MTDFRAGDKIKLGSDVVTEVGADGRTVRVGDTWLFAKDLELVERSGPRLEDLPDGTVIIRSDAQDPIRYIVNRPDSLVSASGHGSRGFGSVQWPWKVTGACPGTRAWDLFMRGNAGWDDDKTPEGDWWRSQ